MGKNVTTSLGNKTKFRQLIDNFGLPRVIITGFLLLLFISAPIVGADLATQITNTINRFSWNAIMVLAMVPMIHSGCGLFLWPASFVLPNALRAANDVRFTMVVSILSMAVWRLGFSYLICVRMGWGAAGVWIAMVVDWVCRVTCFATRFHSGAWKTKYQA